MVTTVENLAALGDFAKSYLVELERLPVGERAVVLGLSGDLGSGKTAFTQALAKAAGISDTVTSPTFVIEKIYKINSSRFERLIHIDAYRLDDSKELTNLGWDTILGDPKNLIVVEWPERVKPILPDDMKKLSFTFIDEETRTIKKHQ